MRRLALSLLLFFGLEGGGLLYSVAIAQTTGSSQLITGTCTSTPCPEGSSFSEQAIVWPGTATASSSWLGYTISKPVLLSSSQANGATIKVTSGTAGLYVGSPSQANHQLIATLRAGQSKVVSGVATTDVLSVLAGAAFAYQITLPAPSSGGTTPAPTVSLSASPTSVVSGGSSTLTWSSTNATSCTASGGWSGTKATSGSQSTGALSAGSTYTLSCTGAGGTGQASMSVTVTAATPDPTPPASTAAELVTATCTGSPCSYGSTISAYLVVWPASAEATKVWLGYTAEKGIYLAANRANGAIIWIDSGSATIYAGRPNQDALRKLVTLNAGGSYTVAGLATDEVLSVMNSTGFTYTAYLPPPPPTPGADQVIQMTRTHWRCNTTGCTAAEEIGYSITWPSWAAYSSNNRPEWSRSTYDDAGQLVYPYMGSWAQGCDVTAQGADVAVLEWKRGSSSWRTTYLTPGQRHVINLEAPEDGAIIEGLAGSSIILRSCTPKVLP